MSRTEHLRRDDGSTNEHRTVGAFWAWYSVVAPPTAWGIHLLLTYFLEAWFCGSNMANVDLWINISTAILLAATIVAGIAGWWVWSAAAIGTDDSLATRWGISGYLGISGIILSILFGLAIIMGDFGVFYLSSCQYTG
jgi:hypothetical protein